VASTVEIPQYSRRKIFGVWAAAALPMGALSWVIAPALAGRLAGEGNLPMVKAMLLLLTGGMIWQFVMIAALLWREQGNLRWSTIREALWLRSPQSPRSGRRGGRMWLILLPLIVAFAAEELIPTLAPANRDFGLFLASDAGQNFLHGNWIWFAVVITMQLFNTVLGEELLFRGLLLPRMNGAFGRRDWLVNGLLFVAYHLHVPWMMPATLIDTLAIAYPAKRYRSAWIGIAVHSAQSVFFAVLLFLLVI
jgi:membrane protease YdiL (CAAX protease family)